MAQTTLCWMVTQLSLNRHSPHPQFSAHVCCGETARWIKMPLGITKWHLNPSSQVGMEVGLGPGDVVLDGDPYPLPKWARP